MIALIDLEPKAYGAHSLRRTNVAMFHKNIGDLRACLLRLRHRGGIAPSDLGVAVDNALGMSGQVDR